MVAGKALLRAADALKVSAAELAHILGTSEATISRVRSGARPVALESKEGELTLLFLRVFRSLDALMGGDLVHARAWLNAQNSHLRGVPLERMRTVHGLVDVAEYLDAMRGAV
jgi:transcriptional regulator with XRE-family HTH domain